MEGDRWHKLEAVAIDEFRRFLVLFMYLWVVFGVFVLNETLILGERHIRFASQGFALINAAVLAKVMLVAEDLKVGRRFDHLPMIYPIAFRSCLYATVFIAFYTLEEIVIGVVAGRSIAASIPTIGGGTCGGIACVWTIMSLSLLPYFTLHAIGQFLGEGKLWNLMFRHRPQTDNDDRAVRR
jgi:hypothetical protein